MFFMRIDRIVMWFSMLRRKGNVEAVKEGQNITGSYHKERRTSLPSSL